MRVQIIAIAAAMALTGAALAQTGTPASTAPGSSSPGMSQGGSGMTPGMDSRKATGSAAPAGPSDAPAITGKSMPPGGPSKLYIVPAHPNALSGDDGSTAGKTNPD